ncbi:MAG: divalent-cation tolerance protein CutA [Hyphomicrobiaceae bacterium]
MDAIDKPVVIYTTLPTLASAEEIGGALVEGGLAACVNILPGMVSIYCWQGQQQRDEELVMIVKTTASVAKAVEVEINQRHPYDVPAVVMWPITGGSGDYLRWVGRQRGAIGRFWCADQGVLEPTHYT